MIIYLSADFDNRTIKRILTKSGDIRWVEDRKTSLFSETGELIGIEGIVIDITERKILEEELLKAKDKAEAAKEMQQELL